jgi:small-conductance mechanosensitive channel
VAAVNPAVLEAWWEPALVAVVATLAALLAYRLVQPLVRRLARHSRTLQAVVERLHRPLYWVAPLAALQLVWQGVPDTQAGIDAVRHVNVILLIGALTATAIAAVHGVVDAIALRHPRDVADNLEARRVMTQARVLSRIAVGVLVFAGIAFVLMTFPRARQFGASLLASAGLSALVVGLAARSVFGNLLAGLQIALTQPIRIDDVLIVEGEWGRVEEITGTYVVLKIWDERRLVIPLQWFIEHPFQNWTRTSAQIIGSVFFWVDYTTELAPLRAEATRLAQSSKDYDGRVCLLQVVDTTERAMQLRLIVSSPSAGQSWDLRCLMREGIVAFLQRTQPGALPRVRAEVEGLPPKRDEAGPRPRPDAAAAEAAEGGRAAARSLGAPPAGAPGGHAVADVNDSTGMAGLTAPTGGKPPADDPAPR